MKKTTISLLLVFAMTVLLLLTSCATSNSVDSTKTLLDSRLIGTWESSYYGKVIILSNGKGAYCSLDNEFEYIYEFQTENGIIYIMQMTNQKMYYYPYSVDGDTLTIGDKVFTKVQN